MKKNLLKYFFCGLTSNNGESNWLELTFDCDKWENYTNLTALLKTTFTAD